MAKLTGDYENPDDYMRMCVSCHRGYDLAKKWFYGHGPNGEMIIDIDDTLLGEKIQIKSDVVVLATGMVPTTLAGEIEAEEKTGEGEETDKKEETLDGKKEAESAEVGAKILNLAYRQGTDLPTLKYGFPDSHYICFLKSFNFYNEY